MTTLDPMLSREAVELAMVGLLNAPDGDGAAPPPAMEHPVDRTPGVSLRAGAVQIHGRFPAEMVWRVVGSTFGRFRLCHENALRADPKLEGRITVRFTIESSGSVSSATDDGSDLTSPTMRQCVVRAFANLSFPKPESGAVTVDYPLIFALSAKPSK